MGHNVQIRAVFCARKSTSAALAGLPGTITRPRVVGTVINASVKNPGNQTQRICGHHHRCLYTSIPECPYAPALTPREPPFPSQRYGVSAHKNHDKFSDLPTPSPDREAKFSGILSVPPASSRWTRHVAEVEHYRALCQKTAPLVLYRSGSFNSLLPVDGMLFEQDR